MIEIAETLRERFDAEVLEKKVEQVTTLSAPKPNGTSQRPQHLECYIIRTNCVGVKEKVYHPNMPPFPPPRGFGVEYITRTCPDCGFTSYDWY